jgi:hypothetical protein
MKGSTHMLSRKGFFTLMMIGFILSVFVTDVMGENLVKYGGSEEGTVSYYNQDSVKQTSETVKVWEEVH